MRILRSLCIFASAWMPTGTSLQFVDFQPEEVVSENGQLDVTLNVGLVYSLPGIPWSETGFRIAPGFNDGAIGPTLRVKPGDTVTVTLNNNLNPSPEFDHELNDYVMDPANLEDNEANVTVIYNRLSEIGNIYDPAYGYWGLNFVNLHFHGLDISPKIEELSSHIDGGETRQIVFQVPENKEPSLVWYHNHVHGTAAASYMSSLMGLIVVEGTDNDLTKADGVAGSREILMLLSEGLVNPDGSVPPFFPIVGQFNWTGVTNGKLGSETGYNVTQGKSVLFRVASASVEPVYRLSIPGITFVVLAYDGLPLPEPEETEVVEVGGGGRVEFLARFDAPGTYVMTRAAWGSGIAPNEEACMQLFGFPGYPCISYDQEKEVATIVVEEDPLFTAPSKALVESVTLPGTSARLAALAEQDAVGTKTLVFRQKTDFPLFQIPYDGPFVPPGVAFGVNDRLLTPNYITGTVAAGTCETWDVISDPPFTEHPLHVHLATFLVTAADGVEVEKPYWRDTVIIQQNVTVHVCFDRAEPGDIIIVHCHAPSHFDIGMGAYFTVEESAEVTAPTSAGAPLSIWKGLVIGFVTCFIASFF